MTESMLKSLMKLFALLATINVETARVFSRNFVESYLRTEFSNKLVAKALQEFDQYLDELESGKTGNRRKRISSLSVKIIIICNEINKELHLKSKFMILFSIIQFAHHFEHRASGDESLNRTLLDAVNAIADALLINEREYRNVRTFILDKFYKVPNRSSLLVVGDYKNFQFTGIRHLKREGIDGQLLFLHIHQADLYIFYYAGKQVIEMGGKTIFPNHVYIFPRGGSLKSEQFKPVYYTDVSFAFRRGRDMEKITLDADRLDFRYPDSDIGVHEMSLHFENGEMIGVMGGSGTGKSTLMRLLNGSMNPDSGEVYINGRPISERSLEVEGLIGFVPQDDLLIEELTVFQNLYFNARLCLGNLDEKEILKRIGLILNSLDLFYIKDLKVGNPLNKYISGGQRKRLNIALELIREPYILFVDEPTSGLSSTDSENVMVLLKEQALKGKIVVINIHQPSSELFKMFDKVVIMDKGGYPVYSGYPLEAISYIKSIAERADATEIECECCGNVETDDILKTIELKKVNEFGEYTKERLLRPQDWYETYREKIEKPPEPVEDPPALPSPNFRIPGVFRQFGVYSLRNLLSKLADRQFMILSLTITPMLAFILAMFTKYQGGLEGGRPVYVFSMNENLPAYIFMSVIVALFVGLIVSAEEIIKDRKILARESYLHLDRHAYLFSKVVFFFVLSAIQMAVFVAVGNSILEIRGQGLYYWIVLFSTSCFAVMLGLNISSGLKSVISIYINIPFILVPLILLSGVIVKYDKLHSSVAGNEYVPVVGDLMASRWSYEALMVNQFKNNQYERNFYEIEKSKANALYHLNFLIPGMQNRVLDLENLLEEGTNEDSVNYLSGLLYHSFRKLHDVPGEIFTPANGTPNTGLMKSYLDRYRRFLTTQTVKLSRARDEVIEEMQREGMTEEIIRRLRNRYHNEAVADLVLNRNDFVKIREIDGKLIRKDTPVFQEPLSRMGRAQFFAGTKQVGNMVVETIWFNIIVLWCMTIILYIALSQEWLRRMIKYSGRLRKKN